MVGVAVTGNGTRAISLVDEVDGLELNAYLTPTDVDEFKKVSRPDQSRRFSEAILYAIQLQASCGALYQCASVPPCKVATERCT
jgi:hypothetical protein